MDEIAKLFLKTYTYEKRSYAAIRNFTEKP
jgi:hypothetical protein